MDWSILEEFFCQLTTLRQEKKKKNLRPTPNCNMKAQPDGRAGLVYQVFDTWFEGHSSVYETNRARPTTLITLALSQSEMTQSTIGYFL